jgi:hypothetical protein
MGWGIECGDGWFSILDRLGSKIEPILVAILNEGNEDRVPKAMQIKEKYGTLRVYMDWQTEEIDEAIRQAEVEAEYTCCCCGKEGKMENIRGWYSVICEGCLS